MIICVREANSFSRVKLQASIQGADKNKWRSVCLKSFKYLSLAKLRNITQPVVILSYWANLILVICIALGAKTVLRQCSLKRCRSTYVVFFKWGMLNATYEDQGNLLSHTSCNTTTYGLHSFRYTPAKMWNKLTEDLSSLTPLNEFRTKICQISFEHQCNCYLCK